MRLFGDRYVRAVRLADEICVRRCLEAALDTGLRPGQGRQVVNDA